MQVSAEIRWFWRGESPDGLRDWFCGAHAHRCGAGGGESRRDVYLRDASQVELGVKYRGKKKGVEVKGLVTNGAGDLDVSPFVGGIEIWAKWTSESLGLPDDHTLTTDKQRWLRKFDTGDSRPREIELGGDEMPLNRESGLPARGCNVELTRVTLLDTGEIWWTLGFESFGSFPAVVEDLRVVAKELASRKPPDLEGGHLASYPAWLAERLKAS